MPFSELLFYLNNVPSDLTQDKVRNELLEEETSELVIVGLDLEEQQ